MSSKMNKDFEKLPDIANKMQHVQWNAQHKFYHAKVKLDADGYVLDDIRYVNGAWYAYQEQQRKYAELEAMYIQQGLNMFEMQKKIYKVLDTMKMQEKYQDRQIDCLCDEIKELLK